MGVPYRPFSVPSDRSVAMLIAVVYVMLNLVADLIVLLLVPKLREPA